jgi:hypothetical protein
MATQKPKKAKAPMVRRMIPVNAVVWVPGQEPDLRLKRYIDDQVNDRTCDVVEVFEKERLRGLMGGYTGNITSFMYSLVGYLTTRKRPLIFSAKHGAASIASLMGEIVKANDLPPVPENDAWPKLKVTDDMEGYTNDPDLCQNKVAAPPPTIEEAIRQLGQVVLSMNPRNQELAIKGFLESLYSERLNEVHHQTQVKAMCDKDMEKVSRNLESFMQLIVMPEKFGGGANG